MPSFSQDILDIVKFDDVSRAVALSSELKKQLSVQGTDSASQNSSQQALLVLRYVCFPSLSDEDALSLLTEDLLTAFDIPDLNIEDKLLTKIQFIQGDLEQIDFVDNVVKALSNNRELLGKNQIMVEGKLYAQEIKNWILDYLSYPSKSTMRENLDELEYINHSPNCGKLSKIERDKLLKILKIYDNWQKFLYPHKYGKEITDEKEAFKDFDLYRTLPGLTFADDNQPEHRLSTQPFDQTSSIAQRPPMDMGPMKAKSVIYKKETIADNGVRAGVTGIQNFPRPSPLSIPVGDVVAPPQVQPRDWVKDAATRRKEEQQKIDEKLQALKSRSNK